MSRRCGIVSIWIGIAARECERRRCWLSRARMAEGSGSSGSAVLDHLRSAGVASSRQPAPHVDPIVVVSTAIRESNPNCRCVNADNGLSTARGTGRCRVGHAWRAHGKTSTRLAIARAACG